MYRIIVALGIGILLSFPADKTGATEYPWEKEAKEQKLEPRKSNQTQQKQKSKNHNQSAFSNSSTLRLGPFLVDRFTGWHFEKGSEGDILKLRDSDGDIKAAIQVNDYVVRANNYQKAQQSFINNFKYIKKEKISFAGKENVLYLRDTGNGVTQVYLFPYTEESIYMIYILINGEYNGLTRTVKTVLDTFRFAE